MNHKIIGIVLIIVAIIAGIGTIVIKTQEDFYINALIDERNSCYLEDGTCLHDDRNFVPYIIGGSVSIGLLLLGIFLLLDRSEKTLIETQEKISVAMNTNLDEEKFRAFLRGFKEDEKKIIQAIHDQEGIKQSTLRFRTGISKTSVSLILKDLENKNVISRKDSGKTKEVYLVKY